MNWTWSIRSRDGAMNGLEFTLIELKGSTLRRREVWPTEELYGLPVLLAGGEVGLLPKWQHAEDHSWWRWSVEFSNRTGRPEDWAPPGQQVHR